MSIEETITGLVSNRRYMDCPPQKSIARRKANLYLTPNAAKPREQLLLEFDDSGRDSTETTSQKHGNLISKRVEVTGIHIGRNFHVKTYRIIAVL